jgi:hypothetical protein
VIERLLALGTLAAVIGILLGSLGVRDSGRHFTLDSFSWAWFGWLLPADWLAHRHGVRTVFMAQRRCSGPWIGLVL